LIENKAIIINYLGISYKLKTNSSPAKTNVWANTISTLDLTAVESKWKDNNTAWVTMRGV
jgi:hypothetical protein